MSNVVSLTRPAPRIWVCGCGCSSFELNDDLTAQCALCGAKPNTEVGGWFAADRGSEWTGDEPVREVAGNGDANFSKGILANRLKDGDAVLAVVVREDGTIHTWTCIETDEQRRWADRKLRKVKSILETGSRK